MNEEMLTFIVEVSNVIKVGAGVKSKPLRVEPGYDVIQYAEEFARQTVGELAELFAEEFKAHFYNGCGADPFSPRRDPLDLNGTATVRRVEPMGWQIESGRYRVQVIPEQGMNLKPKNPFDRSEWKPVVAEGWIICDINKLKSVKKGAS